MRACRRLPWSIFKTVGSAAMGRKLLVEVMLTGEAPASEAAQMLSLAGHDSMLGGGLDAFGDHVFTGGPRRVRAAFCLTAA